MSQKLKKTLIALALAPMIIAPLSGFGLPGVGDVQNVGKSRFSEYRYSMYDLGLGFLESGHLADITGVGLFGQIAGGRSGSIRKQVTGMDYGSFYNEYNVLSKDPVVYNQVGKSSIDTLWREGAKVTASTAVGRKLVSRVTANLIKMNQAAALGADLKQTEQDMANADDETQAAVQQKILAKLKANKDKIDAKHRQALVRMQIAAMGAAIAAMNASQALPAAVGAIPGTANELGALPGEVANNPLDAGKVTGIVNGTKSLVDNVQKLAKDLPSFIKNVNVLFSALGELSGE